MSPELALQLSQMRLTLCSSDAETILQLSRMKLSLCSFAAEPVLLCGCRYAAAPSFPPLPDEVVEGARPISRSVEKNRGLTPHRCSQPNFALL